jgi:SpoVK/Ycf46/Vps4 family AAA+-type ATPase
MTDQYVRTKKRQYAANFFAHFGSRLLKQSPSSLWYDVEPLVLELLDTRALLHLEQQFVELTDSLVHRKQAVQILSQTFGVAAQSPCRVKRSAFAHNVQVVARILGLNKAEIAVVELLLLLRLDEPLARCVSALDNLPYTGFVSVVATLTGVPLRHVKESLTPGAILATSGLVSLDRSGGCQLHLPYEVSQQLMRAINGPWLTETTLLGTFCQPCPPAVLTADDYPTYQTALYDLMCVLQTAIQQGLAGINILLYGPPGVGKTALARLLAAQVKARLYEVPVAIDDGTPASTRDRFAALTMANRVLQRHQGVVLLVDDADDLLPGQWRFAAAQEAQPASKVWLNRLLETNAVPTLWIVNHEANIDEAAKRRFTTSLHLTPPDLPTRVRQWQTVVQRKQLQAHFPQETLQHLAGRYAVSPGLIDTALGAAGLVHGDGAIAVPTLERFLQRALELRDGSSPASTPHEAEQASYDLRLLNASPCITSIVRGVQQFVDLPADQRPTPSVCFLFYGPPGTGKSAFAHYLAQQLHRPLLHKRASDLLSMWLGGTEQNLAQAFRQAQHTQSILFIDEGDSFLQQRDHATHHWEITQVNELLTQLDTFVGGVCIMATNLLELLDAASLRRFIKVRFAPLTLAQRVQAFQRYFAVHVPDGVAETTALTQALRPLEGLTLGDFRVVRQQLLFAPAPVTVAGLLRLLQQEWQYKRHKPAIGF